MEGLGSALKTGPESKMVYHGVTTLNRAASKSMIEEKVK